MDQLRDAVTDWLRRVGMVVFDPADEIPEAVRKKVFEETDPAEIVDALKARDDLDLSATARVLFDDEDLMEIACKRGIGLTEDCDWMPVMRAAALVAFGSFAEWPDTIAGLREEFKRAGASSATTAQFLLED